MRPFLDKDLSTTSLVLDLKDWRDTYYVGMETATAKALPEGVRAQLIKIAQKERNLFNKSIEHTHKDNLVYNGREGLYLRLR